MPRAKGTKPKAPAKGRATKDSAEKTTASTTLKTATEDVINRDSRTEDTVSKASTVNKKEINNERLIIVLRLAIL